MAPDHYTLHIYRDGDEEYVVDSFGYRMARKRGESWQSLKSTGDVSTR